MPVFLLYLWRTTGARTLDTVLVIIIIIIIQQLIRQCDMSVKSLIGCRTAYSIHYLELSWWMNYGIRMQKQMSLEPIFESRQCWCGVNVPRQTVSCRTTGDAECSVPKTSSGMTPFVRCYCSNFVDKFPWDYWNGWIVHVEQGKVGFWMFNSRLAVRTERTVYGNVSLRYSMIS